VENADRGEGRNCGKKKLMISRGDERGEPGSWTKFDEDAMRRALELAEQAAAAGEVPVGAVLLKGESVMAEGWNHPIGSNDPTSHAETEALRAAARRVGNYRLSGSTLYVTLEPCVMCAGALLLARIERLVFATRDLRFGAVRSKFRLADSDLLNHRVRVDEGLFAAEAAELLGRFFEQRRHA
jgi:tRNA(adenine34) deaminase